MLGLEPRCEVSRKCVEIFHTYKGDVLQLKIAEHTADDWLHLYRPMSFNKRLPDIMIRYQRLKTEKERDIFNKDNPDWTTGKEMTKYAEVKRRTESENKGNRHFLEEVLSSLERNKDTTRADKVRSVLATYSFIKN